MKIRNISKQCLVFLLLIFNVSFYAMEQDKPWIYYNDINQACEDFDFDAGGDKTPLVSDDINDPSHWTADPNNDEKLPYDLPFFTRIMKIRKRYMYNPPQVNNDQPITWLILHGTIGQETPDYFDDKDKKQQNFRHIKRAASAYSTRKAKKLELLSYRWAGYKHSKVMGGLSDVDRENAAEILHKFLEYKGYDKNELVVLSHSHGCNVTNYLSRLIKPENPIELMIHFGCPRRQEAHYQPLHYKKLIYFFSGGDWITVLGRVPETEIGESISSISAANQSLGKSIITAPINYALRSMPSWDALFSPSKKEKERSVRRNRVATANNIVKVIPKFVKSGLSPVTQKAFECLDAVDAVWDFASSLKESEKAELETVDRASSKPSKIAKGQKAVLAVAQFWLLPPGATEVTDAIRSISLPATLSLYLCDTNVFKPNSNNTLNESRPNTNNKMPVTNVWGLNTTIDGKKPGHSPIVDSVKYLDDIMQHLSSNYSHHTNSVFNLTIDNANEENPFVIELNQKNINTEELIRDEKQEVEMAPSVRRKEDKRSQKEELNHNEKKANKDEIYEYYYWRP